MNNGMDSDGHTVSLIELLDGSKRVKRSFYEKYCEWFKCCFYKNETEY